MQLLFTARGSERIHAVKALHSIHLFLSLVQHQQILTSCLEYIYVFMYTLLQVPCVMLVDVDYFSQKLRCSFFLLKQEIGKKNSFELGSPFPLKFIAVCWVS